jgi:perosamine synthetase
VERFEAMFAEYIGVRHAVAVKSGTAALHLALAALGIGQGDEVIVPALTFVATANAVSYTGAKPVIVDVDPDTWCMDLIALEGALSERTRAVLPVHLYGCPAWPLYQDYLNLPIVEDACEALGAQSHDVKAGALGMAGCFSFYGNKTITTGEGGMVMTDDGELAGRMRHLRSECTDLDKRFWHDGIGFNYVMTDLQAAVGCAQMEILPRILKRRAEVAAYYREELAGLVAFQKQPTLGVHGNWSVAVLLPMGTDRDGVMAALRADGIETRPMFYPLNTMPMYRGQACPVAESLAPLGLMLPTHAELTDADLERVCDSLERALAHEVVFAA